MLRWLERTRFVSWMIGGLCAVVLAGCGGSGGPATYRVTGAVSLDGQPLREGQIMFRDPAGQQKTYAGKIEEGKYSLLSTEGSKRVEIKAQRKVEGKQARIGGNPGDPIDPKLNPADVFEEAVAPEFNDKSTLTADVKSSGKNEFPFEVTSPKKK
jgi:hypothetical protein